MFCVKSSVLKLLNPGSLQLAIAISFSMVGIPQALLAQEIPQQWEAQEYKVPSSIGVPGRRQQGGTRSGGKCLTPEKRLTALMPLNSYGVTVAAYPTFLFYMPKTADETPPQQAEFILQDENENNVYKATFQTSGKSGVISISLPVETGLQPLQVGKDYHWFFKVICTPQSPDADLSVDGRIKRVEPTPKLSSQLQQATPNNKAKLYAQAEIWYDALTTLAEVRRVNPKDFAAAADWEKLLNSVDLGEIAQESLVPSIVKLHSDLTSSEP